MTVGIILPIGRNLIQGQLIRRPVHDIRIAGRSTQGVTLFRVDKDEHVVSVERLADQGGGEDEPEADAEAPTE